jgi:uncharacterized membrane protein
VSALSTVVASQAAGLVLLCAVLPLVSGSAAPSDLAWGAGAGVAGGLGVALLYRALAIGTMGVVAPTTAVCAVIIPVLAEALAGERLAAQATLGIIVALIAIVLVSQSGGSRGGRRPTGLRLALLSGIAIGFFFLALARTGAGAGLLPLVAARAVSVCLFLAIAAATRQSLRMSRSTLAVAAACGVLDMAANALYMFATRGGTLSLVVTLASLYPASTVVLARVVLGERLTSVQAAGMVSALLAVVLIVSASG